MKKNVLIALTLVVTLLGISFLGGTLIWNVFTQPMALEIGTNGWEAKIWVELPAEPGPLAPIGFPSWESYKSAQTQFKSRTQGITDSAAKELIWRDILKGK